MSQRVADSLVTISKIPCPREIHGGEKLDKTQVKAFWQGTETRDLPDYCFKTFTNIPNHEKRFTHRDKPVIVRRITDWSTCSGEYGVVKIS